MNERIKQLRKMNNLTQTQFANIINISQGSLSDIEKGSTSPSVETLIKICTKFKVSSDWILFGNDFDDINSKYNKLNLEEKNIVDMLFEKAETREKEKGFTKIENL